MTAQQGDAKAAQELFTKAAELDQGLRPGPPRAGPAPGLRARTWRARSRSSTSRRKADPKSVAAARIKVGSADPAESPARRGPVHGVRDQGRAVRAGPLRAHGRRLRAGQSARQGARGLQKQLELAPKSVDARVGLARVAIRQQKDEEAMSQLQAAVKDSPDHLGAVFLLASLAEKLGRYEQGVGPLEAAVKANPNQPTLVLALAKLHLRTGQNDAVIAETTELLRRYPRAPDRPARCGLRPTSPSGMARPLSVTSPSWPVRSAEEIAGPQYLLGRAYAMMGRVPEAQAAYKQALKLDPNLEPAKEELALLSGGSPIRRSSPKRVEASPHPGESRSARRRRPRAAGPGPARERPGQGGGGGDSRPCSTWRPPTWAAISSWPGCASHRVGRTTRSPISGRRSAANPNDLEANVRLARYLSRQNRREEARPLFETALRINPNLAGRQVRAGQSSTRRAAGSPTPCGWPRSSRRRYPKDPTPLTLKGQILLAPGQCQARRRRVQRRHRARAAMSRPPTAASPRRRPPRG